MADWYGSARSNYVRIKDMEGLKKALAPFEKLSDRWHNCGCGASCSRDENAVRTVMRWVEEVLASEGSGTGPARSGRCLAVLKRETHAIA